MFEEPEASKEDAVSLANMSSERDSCALHGPRKRGSCPAASLARGVASRAAKKVCACGVRKDLVDMDLPGVGERGVRKDLVSTDDSNGERASGSQGSQAS